MRGKKLYSVLSTLIPNPSTLSSTRTWLTCSLKQGNGEGLTGHLNRQD